MPIPSPVTLSATAVPAPQVYAGPLIKISDNSVGTNPPTIPHAATMSAGNAPSTLVNWNANATRIDLGGSVYGVPLGVLYGLTLSAGSGLTCTVAVGHANINGIVEISTASTVVLQASTRNWIWLKQNSTFAVQTTTTVPTLPSGQYAVLLGSVLTGSSSVTSLDYSGVVLINSGVLERYVADTGLPGDTPPANWRGYTINASGVAYWWNGTRYTAAIAAGSNGQILTTASGVPTWANIAGSLTAGSNITLSGTTNVTISTINAGTVTSIGLTAPAEFALSGSPVTSSGTIALSWANQSANTFMGGPSSGSPATPGFRALAAADIQTLSPIWTAQHKFTYAPASGSANNWAVRVSGAPFATATGALVELGSGPFDGTTTGFFSGSAQGTHLGINAASGYTGNLIDTQVAGVSQFSVTSAGAVTAPSIALTSGTISSTPASASDIVNKAYADSLSAGLSPKAPCAAASTAALTATYANGASGVGATLTNSGTQAALVIDGYTVQTGDRLLIKDQAAPAQNGIYTATNVGSGASNWVLTRATDCDQTAEVFAGIYTLIQQGTSNASEGYTMNTTGTITMGTTAISWIQFSGAGLITAGTGLSKSGNTLSNTGVLSITGTVNQVVASASTGAITLSLPQSIGTGSSPTFAALTLTAPLTIANGGSGANLSGAAQGALPYINSSNSMSALAAGTANQVLITGGAGANPSWSSLSSLVSGASGVNVSGTTSLVASLNTGYAPTWTAQHTHSYAPATGVANNWSVRVTQTPFAQASGALLEMGAGPFDGSTTGFFSGSAQGTHLGINAASGFTGNLIDAQLAGVSKFSVTSAGLLTAQNITVGSFSVAGLVKANVSGVLSGGNQASLTTDVSGILPTANGGTGSALTTPAQGSVLYANASNVFTTLAPGTANQILTTGGAGANPSYQNIASLLTAGSGITFSGTTNVTVAAKKKAVIVLCAAFTPSGTGADTAEFVVPYDHDGTTSVTWNVARINFRVQTAGGAPAVTVEVSTASTAFSAATIGTVTLGSGAYEGNKTSAFATSTIASGNKVRFNVGTLATATNWTITLELYA